MINNINELQELLLQGCKSLGLDISDRQVEQFFEYKRILLEYNEKVNLTAITDDREVILKHFLDCLVLGKQIKEANYNISNMIDVGTGAGFPGIPLKILFPELKITLVDSLNKRILFLQHVIDSLKLEQIECIHSRSEDLAQKANYREQYDLCTCRAVAYMNTLAEYCVPFVKKGGYFIPMKGSSIVEELDSSKKALDVLGSKYVETIPYLIPFSDISHHLVVVKKVKVTPSKYPRKANEIKKKAL